MVKARFACTAVTAFDDGRLEAHLTAVLPGSGSPEATPDPSEVRAVGAIVVTVTKPGDAKLFVPKKQYLLAITPVEGA